MLSSFFQYLKKTDKNHLALAVFAILIILFYGKTLTAGFVFDDVVQIQNNPYIRSLKYLPKAFTSCQWEYSNKGCYGKTVNYRPPFFVSTILSYQLSPKPWSFHLTNLVYFLILAWLIFRFFSLITNDFLASFIGTTIFIIHPINTEVVDWASAAVELTFAILTMLSLIYYVKYRQTKLVKNLIFVYIFYFFGINAKEPAALLPVIFACLDLFFFKIPFKKLLTSEEIKRYSLFAVPVIIYFLMRSTVIGFSLSAGYGYWSFTKAEWFYAFITLFAKYLAKVFYPYPLLAFYFFQKTSNFLSPTFIISFLATLLVVVLLVISLKKRKYIITLSIIWFFIFLIPADMFLNLVGEKVFSERYVFFPLIGVALSLGYGLAFLFRLPEFRFSNKRELPENVKVFIERFLRPVLIIAAVLVIVVSWTIMQNRHAEWDNEEALYASTLKHNPRGYSVRYNLAMVYFNRGDYQLAKQEFEEIIRLGPDWKDITMAYKGLGDYYRKMNDLDNALASYQKSVDVATPSPRDYVTFNDLGVAYLDKQNYLRGLMYFCQAMHLYPGAEVVKTNLDETLAQIDVQYTKKGLLYDKITNEFQKSAEDKLSYIGRRCIESSCQYEFAFNSPQPEIIIPPLISGKTTPVGKGIAVSNFGVSGDNRMIMIEAEKMDKDSGMELVFPTCGGSYYNVKVEAEAAGK